MGTQSIAKLSNLYKIYHAVLWYIIRKGNERTDRVKTVMMFLCVVLGVCVHAEDVRIDGLCGIKFGDTWESVTNRIVMSWDEPDKPRHQVGGLLGKTHSFTPREKVARDMRHAGSFRVTLDRQFHDFTKEATVGVTKGGGKIYRITIGKGSMKECAAKDFTNEVEKVQRRVADGFGISKDDVVLSSDYPRSVKPNQRKLVGGRYFVTIYSRWTKDHMRSISLEVEDNEVVRAERTQQSPAPSVSAGFTTQTTTSAPCER